MFKKKKEKKSAGYIRLTYFIDQNGEIQIIYLSKDLIETNIKD